MAKRLINILVPIADRCIYFLQLFDSFTTGHEISAQPSLQPLQCGGSAVRDTQESLIFLSTITNRCVSNQGRVLVEVDNPFSTRSFFPAFNLSDACLNDLFYMNTYLLSRRLVILSLLVHLVQNLVGAENARHT